MPGNTFGQLFKITTWGESHGKGVGVVIDGCPPGLPLDEDVIQEKLDKRKPGGSTASTNRKEPDQAIIMSGVFEGKTTGTPILVMVNNKDAKSRAYKANAHLFRPGHGDISYEKKYGIRDWRGGGRASARETVGRVAAGAVASLILKKYNIEIVVYTSELGGVKAAKRDFHTVSKNRYYCPDADVIEEMEKRVAEVKGKGDSLGGVVEVLVKGVPAGLGEPVFDKLDAEFAKALMSIGAVKGVEIGAGFQAANLLGSENNDEILPGGFASNNAGGILAGISNGDNISMRVAVKPIPSISIEQRTTDAAGKEETVSTTGRHDISPIPRINAVIEAMVSLVIADHILRQRAQCS